MSLLKLTLRRLRTPADYRAFQNKLAELSVRQLERRGMCLGGQCVLELGAGEGGYSSVLKQRCATFLATDLRKAPFFAEQQIPFIQFDATQPFPLDDATFDLVWCSSVIEHVTEPGAMLAECRRVFRPGGMLYLSFPPFYSLAMVGGHQFKPFHLLGERYAIWMTNALRGTHYNSYADSFGDFGLVPLRIDMVEQLLMSAGFRPRQVFTRMSPVNTAHLPGILKDLLTWHVCFLAGCPD
jgi:SAM-dependent methyltransferase